ncbi:unnamed protein product [Calypogeia fissa]
METDGAALPHELLVAVLNRLSSQPLAVAACVCHSWRKAAIAVNSTPRLFSALSYLPQLEEAMDEVLGDVLQAPFWPDFAIIFAGSKFKLSNVSALVKKRLPEKMALIACNSAGIAGTDVANGESIEMIFDTDQGEHRPQHGLVLAVGRFPGVHVKAVRLSNALSAREVEKFVEAANTAPHEGHPPVSPFAIMLLGDPKPQPTIFLEALGKAYGGQTMIVGGLATFVEDMEAGCLLAHASHSTTTCAPYEEENTGVRGGRGVRKRGVRADRDTNLSEKDVSEKYIKDDFVALVFTEARDDSSSTENSMDRVRCKVAAAGGLKAVGPVYNVVSVRDTTDLITEEVSMQISCEREGVLMDGFAVLEDIDAEIHGTGIPPNHIGVFRKQKKPNQLPHFSLHELQETNEEYLFISGGGVKTRDSFRFYQLDPIAARNSLHDALSTAAEEISAGAVDINGDHTSVVGRCFPSAHAARKKVIGGLLFGCAGRGHEFFGESNVESYAFGRKFPGISLAGMFCLAEFGPPAILPGTDDEDEIIKGKAIENFFSSMFVLFYTEPGSNLT